MTFGDFVAMANAYWAVNPAQREGQAFFNVLAMLSPGISDEVRATELDPFYRNDNLPGFLRYVERRMGA